MGRILTLPPFSPSALKEERAGVRRLNYFRLKSPHPNPLPARAVRGSRGSIKMRPNRSWSGKGLENTSRADTMSAEEIWWPAIIVGLMFQWKFRIKSQSSNTIMAFRIQRVFAGHVSKSVLLTILLPFSIVSFFGTVIASAFFFPVPYDWSVRAISSLASPRDNPGTFWLPCLGLMASAVLALPFAGYVELRLRGITPRLARTACVAFALACVLLLLTGIVPQQVLPLFGWPRMHEFLARSSAAAFFTGMLCCCICAVRDRFRLFGGQRSLGNALSCYWGWVTLLPVGCAATIGALWFLGHQADQAWAEQARLSFRHSIMWHLAFWEWIGSVLVSMFMVVTVLLLPEGITVPQGVEPEISNKPASGQRLVVTS